MKKVFVLIPTYNRNEALAVMLTSLCFQDEKDFDVVIADQSPDEELLKRDRSLQTVIMLLESKGHQVEVLRNMPPRGLAEQRQFLLDLSTSPYSLFLDDDLVLEPYAISNMRRTIESEGCGFVGCAVIGLSYRHDVRPHQQGIEFWKDKVEPEHIVPQCKEWNRYVLHNAVNIWHVQQKYKTSPGNVKRYKVAWVGGCVMYDTSKLRDVGGFTFWRDLPEQHCGEDVLAQLRVMKKYGGCGIIPSGVYHQELVTTVPERKANAPELLGI